LPNGKLARYYYPNGTTEGGHDGLIVQVDPYFGDSWTGIFAFGDVSPKGITGLYSWPVHIKLCVVSLGQGYLVDVIEPSNYEVIETQPILDVVPVTEREIIVFANYTELVAYGKSGLLWVTKRLSWDGIKITKVTSDSIEGEVWDPGRGGTADFIVNLANGKHEGGIPEC